MLLPAVNGDKAVGRVRADNDAFRESCQHRADHLGLLRRRRSDNDAVCPQVEQLRRAVQGADTAADLNRYPHGFEDCPDDGGVGRLTGACAIEIDNMDSPRSPRLESTGNRDRVLRDLFAGRVVAFAQSNGLAAQ